MTLQRKVASDEPVVLRTTETPISKKILKLQKKCEKEVKALKDEMKAYGNEIPKIVQIGSQALQEYMALEQLKFKGMTEFFESQTGINDHQDMEFGDLELKLDFILAEIRIIAKNQQNLEAILAGIAHNDR